MPVWGSGVETMAILDLEDGLISLQRRATVLRLVLYAYLAATVTMLVLWSAVIGTGIDQQSDPANPLLMSAGLSALVYLLCFLASMVAVCMWVYRAHANLHAAGYEGLEFTPGWAAGWYFVPVAFWFKPFQAMRELWNASNLGPDGYLAPADQRLVIWWACWVIGNILANFGKLLNDMTGGLTVLDLGVYVLHTVSAVFLLLIVNAITRAQSSDLNANYAFA